MSSDERHSHIASIMPKDWDRKPFSLASEIRSFLHSVKDEETNIDSGSSDGSADLWVTVQGVEYYINIRKSNAELAKEPRS